MTDTEKKVTDAKDRIHGALDARADIAANAKSPLPNAQAETIVHASPESSSIVHTRAEKQAKDRPTMASSKESSSLPSHKANVRSQFAARFSHFMDNFQSQVFVASQRINDLTGYTGIERLKREIDALELSVAAARQSVKDSRSKYAETISTRSATQREVNDLLQRKNTWSPSDLERFTNLYRSDHANEQAEQEAHQYLSDAEVQYEEASTRLAKSILARYHEEQIWSDKIRQMSTWGTWGLMGLNVLLFVVLQLAIEPWRRQRLVKGFEEKVEIALASRERENQELRVQLREQSGGETGANTSTVKPEAVVSTAGERVAEAIVDAITGSSASVNEKLSTATADVNSIEAAAEQVTDEELRSEGAVQTGHAVYLQPTLANLPARIYSAISRSCSRSYDALLLQFDTTDYVVLSRRQITTKVIESLATGAALTGGILYIMSRNR